MRYTYFFKLLDNPYKFEEGNNSEAFIKKAEQAAKEYPEAVITVCDRVKDTLIWHQNAFGEHTGGGPCNYRLTGMFN